MSVGKRSWMRSPYERDMRWGTREHLDEMEWQRGVLSKEQDSLLVGDREATIASVLSDSESEGMPDEKLQPDNQPTVDEIDYYS